MRATSDKRTFMQQLARRVHRRRKEFERRHPGRTVPISDTLSRILEHDPSYKPMRKRVRNRIRKPLLDPRISTLRLLARDLETTVADLIGEAPSLVRRPVDVITAAQRRTLRDAAAILLVILDLDDPALRRRGRGDGADANHHETK
jgi:hypothetical protein